jgi:hypothetical protein
VLSKCANPACLSLFRSLNRGKLFVLDTDRAAEASPRAACATRVRRSVHQVERFWLCDGCSLHITLTFEPGRGMVTVPLPPRNTPVPALHLRQLLPTVNAYRTGMKGTL